MKFLVASAGCQLGYDVMKALAKSAHMGVSFDMGPAFCGVTDDSVGAMMPYVQPNITDSGSVNKVLSEIKQDAVFQCVTWTAE